MAAPLALGAPTQLRRSSPRLFDSGYFVLSALDGAPPRRARRSPARRSASTAAARRRGCWSSPTTRFNTDGSRAVGARLLADADAARRRAAACATGVTGGAAILNDYGAATKARLPLVIGAIVLITFLMLVVDPAGAAAGALAVVPQPRLGRRRRSGSSPWSARSPRATRSAATPTSTRSAPAAIFGVTFGLSIDYAVFLLARMRERYDVDGDNRAAIAFGLEKTAGVITGAAAIMAAVFVSFAAAPIATVSQMGVGLTVAILLDATVVRIVLLPALMLLLGDRVWHVPPAARPHPSAP